MSGSCRNPASEPIAQGNKSRLKMSDEVTLKRRQLLCACGDARVITENFGEHRIKISCIGVGCDEESMLWFDSEIEAIKAWGEKYGVEKDF